METNYHESFLNIMKEQKNIALGTSVDGQPNVRVVNFYYDDQNNKFYFTTFKGNQKIAEFEKNNKVAFTTIPLGHPGHVRVKKGIVQLSTDSLDDIQAGFIAKEKDFEQTVKYANGMLALYEILFDQATVILDFEHMADISI